MRELFDSPELFDPEDYTVTYSTGQVMGLTGLSFRQLTHWSDRGYIEPFERGTGSGHPHRWSAEDVRRLQQVAALVKRGMQPAFACAEVWSKAAA